MQQKIIKVGNSYAITIPKGFVDALNVSDETYIHVEPSTKKGKIILDFNPKEDSPETVIDPEIYRTGKTLLERYLPAFKELAKK